MNASAVPRRGLAAGSAAEAVDGPWSKAVTRTLESGRTALADPTTPSRDGLIILLSHLATQERVIADAMEIECPLTVPLAAYEASSLRLRRMLRILSRTGRHDRGADRFDAPTVRRSLIRQLVAHADVEQDLIARLVQSFRRSDAHTFAETYERLMTQALAEPSSALAPRTEHAFRHDHSGRSALIRAAQRAFGRRRAFRTAAGPPSSNVPETSTSTNARVRTSVLREPSWLLRVHARWAQIRMFGLFGAVAIVMGGLLAAGSAPARSEVGAWAAAYLVLVGGVAQIAVGAGQALLARRPLRRVVGDAQIVLWNGGTVAVITGTVAGAPAMADVGGLMLIGVLVLSMRAVGDAVGRGARLYRALMAILAVSVVVGQIVARIHPLG